MKRTGLALALLFVAGGLLADPLFCCTLPAENHVASFSTPVMDCCTEGDTSSCAPKLERSADLPLAPVASASSVLTAAAQLSIPVQVVASRSTDSPARAKVERPPRLHLLHSQFLI
jgi:hypothetical protein